MDLIDRIRELASRIEGQREHIRTEEATKNALVMPFLSALGYDVFNPLEVVPEFTADVGIKKGEKVDYAIKKDGAVVMLVECKPLGADLGKEHASQLFRYFTTTESRFGMLTNGASYRFYSDLEQPNKMDSRPFFEFDVTDFREDDAGELKKFSKQSFSVGSILETANFLKYLRAAKKLISEEMTEPGEELSRFIISRIYEGRITAQVLEQFRPIIKASCKQFLDDKINERLKIALNSPGIQTPEQEQQPTLQAYEQAKQEVTTTSEELEGYIIVKAILRQTVDISRVVMRDTQSYCGILLDDNNRKPICRLHFNRPQKYIGVFDGKQEERVQIKSLNDIYGLTERIVSTVSGYTESTT
ncbi:MAG: type I restriction enzyme HsdR N-terminal domain-containing protein [Thiothrix sp.]|uniref:type I restriction endonuclease n=1 Tax=Thiothrix sp. TaxID=1032 RepID=UPI0026398C14|nr:type I restriction endonuclease [Thiothrix sp.]MDD5392424.1 type I restriction enzyme HsdR N-terminal domain-containing protein [Thiothrix sp.]